MVPQLFPLYRISTRVSQTHLYQCTKCLHLSLFWRGDIFPHCHLCVDNLWVRKTNLYLLRTKVNNELKQIVLLHLKFADAVTAFVGNMTFLYLHAFWFLIWVVINIEFSEYTFDSYPFGLLTMIVSLEAIFLTTLVMVSQNVQAQRAEVRAEQDYQVNLTAEKEIQKLYELLLVNNRMTQDVLRRIKNEAPLKVKRH